MSNYIKKRNNIKTKLCVSNLKKTTKMSWETFCHSSVHTATAGRLPKAHSYNNFYLAACWKIQRKLLWPKLPFSHKDMVNLVPSQSHVLESFYCMYYCLFFLLLFVILSQKTRWIIEHINISQLMEWAEDTCLERLVSFSPHTSLRLLYPHFPLIQT